MPIEEPPTLTANFLAAVATMTWSGSHLADTAGLAHYPVVNERRETWNLATSPGLSLTQVTHQTLATSTANADGSCTDAAGVHWRLDDVPTPGWASLVPA